MFKYCVYFKGEQIPAIIYGNDQKDAENFATLQYGGWESVKKAVNQ